MDDLLRARWADVLIRYSLDVQPGQVIAIEAMTTMEPLIRALHAAILRAGGYPVLALALPGLGREFFALAAQDQLDVPEPSTRFIIEHVDGRVQIMSAGEPSPIVPVDPVREARWQRAQRPLLERFFQRLDAGELRYVSTLYPSESAARNASMALDAFTDLVAQAALLDRPDPVAAWRELSARQQRLIDWLRGREEVRICADGTDLRLSIKGRPVCNADGHLNMPDGEIYTAPLEHSAEGTITFAEGIRLRFEGGRVVEANGGNIRDVLAVDDGAHRVGEFAFGTNNGLTRLTGNTALDEKVAGTVHLALGASLPGTGGVNMSATHRDLVCDLRRGGAVTVDGAVFLDDGRFQVS